MSCRTSFTLVDGDSEKPYNNYLCSQASALLQKFTAPSPEQYAKTIKIEKRWPETLSDSNYNFLTVRQLQCIMGCTENADYDKCTQTCLKKFGGRIKLSPKDSTYPD